MYIIRVSNYVSVFNFWHFNMKTANNLCFVVSTLAFSSITFGISFRASSSVTSLWSLFPWRAMRIPDSPLAPCIPFFPSPLVIPGASPRLPFRPRRPGDPFTFTLPGAPITAKKRPCFSISSPIFSKTRQQQVASEFSACRSGILLVKNATGYRTGKRHFPKLINEELHLKAR